MKQHVFKSNIGLYIPQFMEYSKPQLSESSYERRYSQLALFDEFLFNTNFKDKDIDEYIVNKWIHSLTPLSDKTIMTYTVSIRKFLEYLNAMGVAACYLPPVRKVSDNYVAHIFSENELNTIYSFIDDYPCGKCNGLPYIKVELPMVLRILESCGTRLNETLSLQMKNVDLKHGTLTIVHAKKHKERIVPMAESLATILERYCMGLGIIHNPDAYIFPRKDFSAHLGKNDIYYRFSNILKWNKLVESNKKKFSRGICPHCLRHSFALRSLKKLESMGIHLNDAIPYLSIFLGHERFQETEKYLKFSAEMFPDELGKFDEASISIFPDDSIWADFYEEVIE